MSAGVRVEKFWHKDQHGWDYPNKLIGKTFIHTASKHLYIVQEALFDATGDQWSIVYDRMDADKRKEFRFVRSMTEFMDGRFVEVE